MNEKISCTYIGHATTLIDIGDSTILTDAHFGTRVLWARRQAPLPIDPANLPDLSCILLRHAHADHLNISSYKFIHCGVPIIVPEGCDRAVSGYLSNPIIELSHYATYELTNGTVITAVPRAEAGENVFTDIDSAVIVQ